MKENKKPLYKKWWFWLLIIILLPAIITGVSQGIENSSLGDKEVSTKKEQEEPRKEKDEAEKEKKEEPKEEKTYTDEDEKELLKTYDNIIDESEGVIYKIEQEDNYDIINVYVKDNFDNMNKEQKQIFVDDFGNKIENNTRARLFGTGSSDFKYVYFKNSKGEMVAETGHFDRGWKIK